MGVFDAIVNGVTNVAQGFGHQYERNKNWHYQKNRLQYMVKDAEAAGIHPVYALSAGMPQVGAGSSVPGMNPVSGIDRSIQNAKKEPERKALADAQIQNVQADTALKEAQAKAALSNVPTVTKTGQGHDTSAQIHSGQIEITPAGVTTTRPDDYSTTPGKNPAFMESVISHRKNGYNPSLLHPRTEEGLNELEGMVPVALTGYKNIERGVKRLKNLFYAASAKNKAMVLSHPTVMRLARKDPKFREWVKTQNRKLRYRK